MTCVDGRGGQSQQHGCSGSWCGGDVKGGFFGGGSGAHGGHSEVAGAGVEAGGADPVVGQPGDHSVAVSVNSSSTCRAWASESS